MKFQNVLNNAYDTFIKFSYVRCFNTFMSHSIPIKVKGVTNSTFDSNL